MKRTTRHRISILGDEEDDPMASAMNIVDVFFVAMVILMIAVVQRSVPSGETMTVIRNAGEPSMEITVTDGRKTERFRASGSSKQGNGTKAGVAYRMNDGTMVYVPLTGGEESK